MGFEQEMSETKTAVAQLASWCLTVALHQEFGRGADRLERLRQAGRDNYRQFNEWAKEDGLEVAMERLRRCVHAALREEVRVVDERSSHYRADAAAMEQDLRAAQAVADRIRASRALAVPGIAHTDAEQGEIFARCAAETANSWRHR